MIGNNVKLEVIKLTLNICYNSWLISCMLIGFYHCMEDEPIPKVLLHDELTEAKSHVSTPKLHFKDHPKRPRNSSRYLGAPCLTPTWMINERRQPICAKKQPFYEKGPPGKPTQSAHHLCHPQYRSKVSWQSRLETWISILDVFDNRVPSFEAQVSTLENRVSRIEYRETNILFSRNSKRNFEENEGSMKSSRRKALRAQILRFKRRGSS